MTTAESIVWRALRGRQIGAKFRRQTPIGPYIVDFFCPSARLIVELDGPTHETSEQQAHDIARDAWLRAEGYTVLRFANDLAIGGTDLLLDHIRSGLGRAKPS